jgi:exopolysaccharide production protein ExoZ
MKRIPSPLAVLLATTVGSPAGKSSLTKSQSKIPDIQLLRAGAALLVVLCHGSSELLRTPNAAAIPVLELMSNKGLFGVDIFFVVSGFIMFLISNKRLQEVGYAGQFLADRIIRIVPLYYLVTTLMICVTIFAPEFKHNNPLNIEYILSSYCFVPTINPITKEYQPILGIGWTLNYEMFFYSIFAFGILVFRRRAFYAIIAILIGSYIIGRVFHVNQIVFQSWTKSIILEFMFGIFIARLYTSSWRLPGLIAALLVAGGAIVWMSVGPSTGGSPYRGFIWGVPAALIVGALVLSSRDRAREKGPVFASLIVVGDASYSLYLTHLFVMRIFTVIFSHTRLTGIAYTYLYLIVFTLGAICVAVLSYRYFELPTNRIGHRSLKSWNRNRLASAVRS